MSMFPHNVLSHYTTLSICLENILPTNKVRLSSLKQLNDLKESKERRAITYKGLDRECKGSQLSDEYHKQMNSYVKVLCLSCNSTQPEIGLDGKSYALPNMWAHYADKHRGVALLFDLEKLKPQINLTPLTLKEAKPIIYDRFNVYSHDISRFGVIDNKNPIELVNEKTNSMLIPSLYIKDSEWSTEQEFRLTVYDTSGDEYAFINYGDSLSGIVIGSNFPYEYLPSLKKLRPKGIPVGQYRISEFDGRYELIEIDLSRY